MRKSRISLAAGAIIAVVLVSGVACSAATPLGSGAVDGYCAEMPDSLGLYPGNPVTQMGFGVGEVESVVPRGDHVEVRFSLDRGRRYPADVQAVTRSKSLLADRSLELVGNYAAGPELETGTCIPLDRGFTPKSISEITGSAADFIDAVAPANGQESLARALAGLDTALDGQGVDAAELMQHAATAMSNPDRMISDVGTAIATMAPLTEEALREWASIRSIMDQMPVAVGAAAYDFLPGVIELGVGVSWACKTLYDIQVRYGGDIWPFAHGGLTDVIRLAATRSKDIAALLGSIPAVSGVMGQASGVETPALTYQQPTVVLGIDPSSTAVPLLDLLLAKEPR